MIDSKTIGRAILFGEIEPAERRAGVSSAVQRMITCPAPECGRILNERTAVLFSRPGNAAILCPECAADHLPPKPGITAEAWDWRREGRTLPPRIDSTADVD